MRSRHAAEWGLASLLLGGLLVVMAMLMLQMNMHMFLSPRIWSPGDARNVYYAAIAGSIVMAVMTGTSIAFGIRSLVVAYKGAESCAIGWAGLLMSILALLLWIGTFIDLFAIVDMLMHGMPVFGLGR